MKSPLKPSPVSRMEMWYRPLLSEVDSIWVDCGWGDCLHVLIPAVGWRVL
jgi:hypothetical protein